MRRALLLTTIIAVSPAHALSATPAVGQSANIGKLLSWFVDEKRGEVSDAITVGESPMGIGPGLLAARDVNAGECIMTVPGSACMSALDAVEDPDIGEAARLCLWYFGYSTGTEGMVTAALLAMARYAEGSAARKRWGPYADSLPWAPSGGDSGESDPMAFHPFMSSEIDWMRSSLGPKYYQCKAAAYNVRLIVADAVGELISEEQCFRALMLVASRCFELTDLGSGSEQDGSTSSKKARLAYTTASDGGEEKEIQWGAVMVPALDLCNHPSISGIRRAGHLGERFQAAVFSSEAWRAKRHPAEGTISLSTEWAPATATAPSSATEKGLCSRRLETLTVRSPSGLDVKAGEELLKWYGDAGWGEPTAEERHEKEAGFVAQFGFSPWQ